MESHIGKPRTDRTIVSVSNTKTGVVGVTLNEALNRYGVSWIEPDGKQGKTTVSINKYGKVDAFVRACNIREEKEAKRLGQTKQSNNKNISSHHIRSKSTHGITFKISEELLEKIEVFNSSLGVKNRSEAIRILLEKGLKPDIEEL